MLKDFQKIYKLLKSYRKFDSEPAKSSNQLDRGPSENLSPDIKRPDIGRPGIGQPDRSPLPATDKSPATSPAASKDPAPLSPVTHPPENKEKQSSSRTPAFYKRLYNALYIEALFFVLVQINAARAATDNNKKVLEEDAPLLAEDLLSETSYILPPSLDTPSINDDIPSTPFSLDDFIDPSEQPIGIIPTAEEGQQISLLNNLATHDNFKLLDSSKLPNKDSVGLAKFNAENQLDIFDIESSIVIELDDEDLVYSDENLALFAMDDHSFLVVNNDLLEMFSNNTQNNSWESLRPGEEYFILRQEDIFEEDIEVISTEKEVYLDEDQQITETVNVDYFVYNDTVIGLAFTLPEDFYQTHDSFNFEFLFT